MKRKSGMRVLVTLKCGCAEKRNLGDPPRRDPQEWFERQAAAEKALAAAQECRFCAGKRHEAEHAAQRAAMGEEAYFAKAREARKMWEE